MTMPNYLDDAMEAVATHAQVVDHTGEKHYRAAKLLLSLIDRVSRRDTAAKIRGDERQNFVVHQSLTQANLDAKEKCIGQPAHSDEVAPIYGRPIPFVTEARCRERERAAYERGAKERSVLLGAVSGVYVHASDAPQGVCEPAHAAAARTYPDPA